MSNECCAVEYVSRSKCMVKVLVLDGMRFFSVDDDKEADVFARVESLVRARARGA